MTPIQKEIHPQVFNNSIIRFSPLISEHLFGLFLLKTGNIMSASSLNSSTLNFLVCGYSFIVAGILIFS